MKIFTIKRSFFLLLAVLIITSFNHKVKAQSTLGKEFWLCFPGNYLAPNPALYITAEQATTVTVTVPGIGYKDVLSISEGGMTMISLPRDAQVQSQFIPENLGVHITSTSLITVFGINEQNGSTDGYVAYPVNAIGSQYYVMAYNKDSLYDMPTQATIVATENNTTITITPTITGGGLTAGIPANILLQQGEVYQLRSLLQNADYTGTKVSANKRISVFGGAQCTNISGPLRGCDHLVEQMPPLDTWGRNFLTAPIATRKAGDVFRFMAQVNQTVVKINGTIVANLNAGKFFETILSSASYNNITSNEPILVGQYSRSYDADNVSSDPSFALLPPTEQFLNSYLFSAGTKDITANYCTIISPQENINTVKADGAAINKDLWHTIPATNYAAATLTLKTGLHKINSKLPVGLQVYGYGNANAYAYAGGQLLSKVADVKMITLATKNDSGFLNKEQCFRAKSLGKNNVAVSGIKVDFTIHGPNADKSFFAFTNDSGIATFCYAGSLKGKDTIIATIGNIADSVYFNWKECTNCNIQLTTKYINPACYSNASGAIQLGIAGAAQPVTYLWSNGETTQNITKLKAGTYTVKVTDKNNCIATSSILLTDPPLLEHSLIFSPKTIVTGKNNATIYKGYGPQSVTITATTIGGTEPITFNWGDYGTNASITVSPKTTTIYTCIIKDKNGCTSKVCNVKINVIDVRCAENKISICHKIAGTNTTQNLCVDKINVPEYLNSGDRLGNCEELADSLNTYAQLPFTATTNSLKIITYPNPAINFINTLWSPEIVSENLVLRIYNTLGKEVLYIKPGKVNFKRLDISKFNNGLYLLQVHNPGHPILAARFIIQK